MHIAEQVRKLVKDIVRETKKARNAPKVAKSQLDKRYRCHTFEPSRGRNL